MERLELLAEYYNSFSRRDLAVRLALDFSEYCKWVHFTATGTEYDMELIHKTICDKLQSYTECRNLKRNLMINCPPGAGKSLVLQYWITWNFARNKQCMFCYVAFSADLIKKLSRESRNLMMLPEWEELFGKEMDPSNKKITSYNLISGGLRSGLTAGSIQSGLLGLDAGNRASKIKFNGALILDDINSPEIYKSLMEQVDTPNTYKKKLMTRRRTPWTPTICIMQRHCKYDFAGWVQENIKDNTGDEWEFLIIPAINEKEESFYPSMYPLDNLLSMQESDPFTFSAMYQQDPLATQGNKFKIDWFRYYDKFPEKFKKVFITTDLAFTLKGDYSVMCCWGLGEDKNLYLLRMTRGRWESPDVKKQIVEFFNRCYTTWRQCRRVYIENTLSGLGMIQDLRKECPQMAIIDLKRGAKKNKVNRADSAATWLEAGRVYIREQAPTTPEIIAEFVNYEPSSKNPKDDIVDNFGDACEIAFNTSTGSIFI